MAYSKRSIKDTIETADKNLYKVKTTEKINSFSANIITGGENMFFNIKQMIITLLAILFPIVSNATNKESNRIYEVGVYENKPYFYIDKLGNYNGFYYDLLELISKELDITFKYRCASANSLEELYNGYIDIFIGLQKDKKREEKFIFSDNYLCTEVYGIYTKRYIKYGDLESLEGLKFGLVKDGYNSEYILNLLDSKGITVIPIVSNTGNKVIELLDKGQVDAIIMDKANSKSLDYINIFEYSSGPVYIASNLRNKSLIANIDDVLSEYKYSSINPIEDIKLKYFKEKYEHDKDNANVIIQIIGICVLMYIIISIKVFYPKIKLKKVRKSVKKNLDKGKYLLYYQPIVNPKSNTIMGFESLLRYQDDKLGILSPYYFLDVIESSNMIREVSLWVVEKVFQDYETIVDINHTSVTNDFYISLNLSVVEIEDKEFRTSIINILKNSNIDRNIICLEIIESVRIKSLNKIQEAIKELKQAGYLIAIDDFGVEYSNLDILTKLEFDIIKIDKYFIDEIEDSVIRKKIIDFISDISLNTNRAIIAEGVEKISQKNIIKDIDNDKFYIQGYLYSRPVDINEIQNIKIN